MSRSWFLTLIFQVVGILRPSGVLSESGVRTISPFPSPIAVPSEAIQVPELKGLASSLRSRKTINFSPLAKCKENQSHPFWSDVSGRLLHSLSIQACPETRKQYAQLSQEHGHHGEHGHGHHGGHHGHVLPVGAHDRDVVDALALDLPHRRQSRPVEGLRPCAGVASRLARMPAPTARIRVGIDVGGTFTDAVMVRGGRLRLTKARTTPADFSKGFVDALEALPGVSAADVELPRPRLDGGGNAIVQGRTARVGLLTTAGFADTLPIGTQQRARALRPAPAAARAARARRPAARGARARRARRSGRRALDEDDVTRAAGRFARAGVEAVARVLPVLVREPRARAGRRAAPAAGASGRAGDAVVPGGSRAPGVPAHRDDGHQRVAPAARGPLRRRPRLAASATPGSARRCTSCSRTAAWRSPRPPPASPWRSSPRGRRPGVIGAARIGALAGHATC